MWNLKCLQADFHTVTISYWCTVCMWNMQIRNAVWFEEIKTKPWNGKDHSPSLSIASTSNISYTHLQHWHIRLHTPRGKIFPVHTRLRPAHTSPFSIFLSHIKWWSNHIHFCHYYLQHFFLIMFPRMISALQGNINEMVLLKCSLNS